MNKIRFLAATAGLFFGLGILPLTVAGATLRPAPGLNPGDQYRIVFVTSGGRDARSADIADYNAFVNDAANASGSLLAALGVTWRVIASTAAVSAATNIGGPSGLPIYLLDRTLVANGTADLFASGNNLAAPVDITATGTIIGLYSSAWAWTGSNQDGSSSSAFPLGVIPYEQGPVVGDAPRVDGGWIYVSPAAALMTSLPLYSISDPITVSNAAVPEPTTAAMVVAGAILAFRARRSRR